MTTSSKSLAFYTCFFGGRNNYSFLIPPIPSIKYDCYYRKSKMEENLR